MRKGLFTLFASVLAWSVSAQGVENEKIKPALIVIDIQNAYIGMMDQSSVDTPIKMINAYVWLFNQKKLPVIYVYHTDVNYGPAMDSEGFQYIEQIKVPDDAKKVVKNYGNSFNKTDLDKILKELGCNTLFLCGLSASGCVMSTWVGGNDLDYNTFVIKDAIMSPDMNQTNVMKEVLSTVDFQAVKFMANL